MKKVKVIVCSNAALDYLDYPKDIEIFRSKIHFGDEAYDDFTELSAADFYRRLAKNPKQIPSTSYVSIGHIEEVFNRLYEEGYQEAFVITIAKPLSGLYEAVINIAKEVKLKVHTYDSKTLAYPEAHMALTAYKMFQIGYPVTDVIATLDYIRSHQKMFVAVDTLLYLVKNGRLSRLQGTLGTLLSIKPVLTLNPDGKVETLEKIRTTPKALRRIFELYDEETQDKDVITFINHAHNKQGVEVLTEMIKEKYPERQVIVSFLTPVVGAHAGPKAIALGYIETMSKKTL